MYSMVTVSPFFGFGPSPLARTTFSKFGAILFEVDRCRVAMCLGAAALDRNESACRWGVIDDIVLGIAVCGHSMDAERAEGEWAWWGAADRV